MSYQLFAFAPDASQPLLERLTWSTDIQTGYSGVESRRMLRRAPRYHVEYMLNAHVNNGNGYARVLNALRAYTGNWLVPLWPHAVDAPALPTVGLDAAQSMMYFTAGGLAAEVAGGLPYTARQVMPAAMGLLTDAVAVTHTTDGLASAKVALETLNHLEVVGAYDTYQNGYPVFNFDCDWSSGASETITPDTNPVDFGGLWTTEVRHLTRTVSLTVFADTPAKQARLRAFLFAVKGSYGAFYAQPDTDAAASLWRLNADAVELLYQGGLVTAALTLKQI
ncbi:hypothetical protein [Burkholderia cepacia]|uniref:hypothetical protein n=1 Tax=Burkholderia cepacia TaxID=292 RepID=UPI00075AEFBF|nr:hypothetical protein [Burkholderia cepacia]KWF99097.1 hypothetical protein WL95_00335 [Burkholderia cepacia]